MKRKLGESPQGLKILTPDKGDQNRSDLYNLSRLMRSYFVLIVGEEFYKAKKP